MSHQIPLVISFIDNEQVSDSAYGRALAKILYLYGILDKYIKVAIAMPGNNISAVRKWVWQLVLY